MTRALASTNTLHFMIVGAFLLGAANWFLDPRHGLHWLAGMVTMPVLYGLVLACKAVGGSGGGARRLPETIRLELSAAAALILFAMRVMLLNKTVASGSELLLRASGLVFAFGLMLVGNARPKSIAPLSAGLTGVLSNRMNRFSGTALFVTGLFTMLVWMVFPVDLSNGLAMAAGVTCLAAISAYRFTAQPYAPVSADLTAAQTILLRDGAK